MNGKLNLLVILALALACQFLTGCAYTNPVTGNTYLFTTDYNSFSIEESLNVNPSNYVGFCFLPMKEADENGTLDLIKGMCTQYFTKHGYVVVTKDDLMEDTSLLDYTFLIGIDYNVTLLYERFDLGIQLYNASKKDKFKNHLFWSFSCQVDKFPITRETLEPVFQDLFEQEPVDWGEYQTLFPNCSVKPAIFNEFNQRLDSARERINNRENFEQALQR